jgi:hypothetical protein
MNASMSPSQADHDRRIGRQPDRVSTDLFTKDLLHSAEMCPRPPIFMEEALMCFKNSD